MREDEDEERGVLGGVEEREVSGGGGRGGGSSCSKSLREWSSWLPLPLEPSSTHVTRRSKRCNGGGRVGRGLCRSRDVGGREEGGEEKAAADM